MNQKLRFRAFHKYMDIFVGDLKANVIFENIKIFRKSRDRNNIESFSWLSRVFLAIFLKQLPAPVQRLPLLKNVLLKNAAIAGFSKMAYASNMEVPESSS